MNYQQYTAFNSRKNALLNHLEYILCYSIFIEYFSIEMKEEFDFFEIVDIEKKLEEDTNQKINNILELFRDKTIILHFKELFLDELKHKISSLLHDLNELTEPINHLYTEEYHFNFTTIGENQIHSIILQNGITINNYFNEIFDLENLSSSNQNSLKQAEEEEEQEFEINTSNNPNKLYTNFEKVLLLRLLKKYKILNLERVTIESEKKLLNLIFDNPTHSFTRCYSGKSDDIMINDLVDEVITKRINKSKCLKAYNKLKPLLNEFNNDHLNIHLDNLISKLSR